MYYFFLKNLYNNFVKLIKYIVVEDLVNFCVYNKSVIFWIFLISEKIMEFCWKYLRCFD